MTSYLFASFFCAVLLCQSDSLPRWSWGKFAEFETLLPQNNHMKDCVEGQCFAGLKCPENETTIEEPTTCSKRSGGPWICCVGLPKNESIKPTEKTETPSRFIESIINSTNNSSALDSLTSPDWISVEINAEHNKEGRNSSQETAMEYKQNANIINWGKSHDYTSPKYTHREDLNDDVDHNHPYKPYIWSKVSTSNPINKTTEDKWVNPVSVELRNKNPSDADYDLVSENSWENSWNHNRNPHGTRKTTKNWIKTTSSGWSSTKSYPDRDHLSSKSTKWEGRTTANSYVKPTSDTRDKGLNSRSTTKSPMQHSWTKSTKFVTTNSYPDRDHLSSKSTKWEGRTTANSYVKPTSETRDKILNSRSSTKSPMQNSWTKSTKFVRAWTKLTKQPWNQNSSENTEKKSTKVHQSFPTTRKPVTRTSTKASSTTKPVPRITSSYTSRQTVNNRLITPRSSPTRPTVSTQKPKGVVFENIEKSGSSSKLPSSTSRSTTKKHTRTTPLPDVNSQKCGIRVESREAPRRGKRQVDSEEVFAFTGTEKNRSPFQRIVGGTEVEPFSWPWVAALYRVSESGGNRFLSAGSLINRNFVLTAAHVFTPGDLRSASFVVMLGTHTAREAVAEYRVMYVLQHPNYQQRYYYNDIALLRLESPVDFNEYVMPVCLPSPSLPLIKEKDLEGKQVTVMGWGDESYGGRTSRVLKEASFPIVPRKPCNESYFRVASNRFPRGITSNMICAGDPNGGKDACQGDSGGPLTAVENGRHTQVGIVSFGYKCGDKEYPGVYTKVSSYITWIAENARCDDYSDRPYYY